MFAASFVPLMINWVIVLWWIFPLFALMENEAAIWRCFGNYKNRLRKCFVKVMFFKINFSKFTAKRQWWSLFLNKVPALQPATLLKKEISAVVFSCEFREIYRRTYFAELLRRAAFGISHSGNLIHYCQYWLLWYVATWLLFYFFSHKSTIELAFF